ncbi:LPS export ABC transporter periplasmic protein LptC [Flavobacterium pallidum]|uniref:LPS export ABC transporter periplasmic protein LptC n=1 Tax=Flavobacterium pallidum TaxID=2172098 RepID=A0A2S1SGB7_9FLAO|nr:LPS export ABC transporter periplasmic protein LptC [Flavobacterium pallidum]
MTRKLKIQSLLLSFFAIPFFWSCESNFKDVQKFYFSEFMPTGEADSINLKYTDSGKITAVLASQRMLDYSSVRFPFTEFPKGIDLTLFDKNAKKTFIKSDYAVSFKGTDMIDLRGNVRITSENGQQLTTEQLYFDQKNEWFFTEKNFKFTDPKSGSTTGEGIDFNKDFTRVNFQKVKGLINQSANTKL